MEAKWLLARAQPRRRRGAREWIGARPTPAAHAAQPTSALFDLTQPGPQDVDGDTAAVELGVHLSVSLNYLDEGVTFYRPPGFEATNSIVRLYETVSVY